MKKLNGFLRNIFLFLIGIIVVGCSSVSENYNNINDSYNQKNNTAGRSIIADTIIASAFYNNPELIQKLTWGKSKTHKNETTSTNTLSTTTTENQSFTNGNSNFTTTQSVINTKTQSKTKSKSVTTGVSLTPNLDYYLK